MFKTTQNPDRPDHEHTCRECGGGIPCWIPNDECNDIPSDGQCEDCAAKERQENDAKALAWSLDHGPTRLW